MIWQWNLEWFIYYTASVDPVAVLSVRRSAEQRDLGRLTGLKLTSSYDANGMP